MTANEMEVAYCKARITCMKSFRLLLSEHIELLEEAVTLGLTYEQAYKLMKAGLSKVKDELEKDLKNGAKMISDSEKAKQTELDAVQEEPAESGTV